jgi:hypothetical protein
MFDESNLNISLPKFIQELSESGMEGTGKDISSSRPRVAFDKSDSQRRHQVKFTVSWDEGYLAAVVAWSVRESCGMTTGTTCEVMDIGVKCTCGKGGFRELWLPVSLAR